MWLVCCLNLARAVLPAISPIATHNKTDFVNHAPIITYQGTNLYIRKSWPEIPKLLQIQICSLVPYCWRMVHKTWNQLYYALEWGKFWAGQPLLIAEITQVMWWVLASYKLLCLGKLERNTDFSYKSSFKLYLLMLQNTFTTLWPYHCGFLIWKDQIPWMIFGTALRAAARHRDTTKFGPRRFFNFKLSGKRTEGKRGNIRMDNAKNSI